jgi:hypothetical protein
MLPEGQWSKLPGLSASVAGSSSGPFSFGAARPTQVARFDAVCARGGNSARSDSDARVNLRMHHSFVARTKLERLREKSRDPYGDA